LTSESLGNGIDPLDVVSLFGADAFRWTLIAGLGLGADVILDPADIEKSFATGRNFATKLWNIGRFLLANVGDEPVRPIADIDPRRFALADAWVLDRLEVAIAECDAALGPLQPTERAGPPDGRVWRDVERSAGMRLNEFAETARRFGWNELAEGQIGGDHGVPPGKAIDVAIIARGGEDGAVYEREAGTIARLTRAQVRVGNPPSGAAAHAVLRGGAEVVVPLAELIDVAKECQRLRGELESLEKQIVSREQRLGNPKYVERAPEHVVRSDRATLEEMVSKRGQLSEKVRALCGA